MASSPLQIFNAKIDQNDLFRNQHKNGINKINNGTPKRRLSYNGNNSTPIAMSKNLSPFSNIKNVKCNEKSPHLSNDENHNDSNNSSPFIKRKCITKEQNNVKFNNSPFLISSSNLYNIADLNHSPKHLNESFETLQLASNQDTLSRLPSRTGNSRYLSRRASHNSGLFSKHKSAPLTCFNLMQQFGDFKTNNEQKPNQSDNNHQPLNDISNQFNSKSMNNNAVNIQLNKNIKKSDDLSFSDEQKDDVTDLENLIFGTNSTQTQQNIMNHQHFIKQSLDVDATCRNLIGDRTKQHILPVITSSKHQDLYCISPETLVDVLNKKYDDQIDEYVIIDSRYPYEFEGGHIKNALNIFTKEKLYEEMFLKRLNYKNTNFHKFPVTMSSSCLTSKLNLNGNNHSISSTSISSMEASETDLYSSPIEKNESNSFKNEKRVIIIFHCEFSSERGPSLLRFLRNQDRSLNEHIYPHLFYPELYLLEGGYKSFYENFKNYCDPQTYKPMLHAEHLHDLKHFRAKAKSWEVSRHNYFFKCSDSLQRKQVILNQMARNAVLSTHNNACNDNENQL